MKTINCAECNAVYQYEPSPNYPDKRKYCANCSEKKAQTWEARGEPTEPVAETVSMNLPVGKEFTAKPIKEFHLSPEQVRTNALNLALKWHGQLAQPMELMDIARAFEEYLWNGN
jgi:hypothetical protein